MTATMLSFPGCSACDDDDDDDAPPPAPSPHLAFVVQPTNTPMNSAISPPITVEIRDGGGNLIGTATDTVTLAFQNNAGMATLGGTLSQAAVGGTATFNDITVDTAGVGYTLRASATGYSNAVSAAFTVTQVGPTQVVITTDPPATVAPFEAFTVVAEIRDAMNVIDTTFNGPVTIAFGAQPAGDLLVHASGLGTPIIELIETDTPSVVREIFPTIVVGEVMGMVYDPAIQLIRGTNLFGEFFLLDPVTGDCVLYGNSSTLSDSFFKGVAFNGMGQIRALSRATDQVSTIDLVTGIDSQLGTTLTLTSYAIAGCNGLSRHPTSGVFYAILNNATFPPEARPLVTVNMGSGVCTLIGDTGDAVAGITFAPDGTLYAVTGDGASTPSTLWSVNTSNGALTNLLTLGNGDDGETIVYIPRRLGGTLTVNAVNGVATFTGLSIDQLGSGYTLTVSSSGLTPDTSSAVDVTGAVSPTATVEFSAAASSVAENVGGGLATVTVQLSGAEAHDIPVMIYIDTTSTALPIDDHNQPLGFQVIIPAGQTSVDFTIPIVDDGVAEADEDVILTLFSANLSAGGGGNLTHTLTITNDD